MNQCYTYGYTKADMIYHTMKKYMNCAVNRAVACESQGPVAFVGATPPFDNVISIGLQNTSGKLQQKQI